MKNFSVLEDKIYPYLNKKLLFLVASGIINLFILLIIIWLSSFIADHIFYFSIPVRWFVLIVNAMLSIYLTYRILLSGIIDIWKMKKSGNFTPLTREIGSGMSSVEDTLTNIYQLSRESDHKSKSLRDLAIDRFTQKIDHLDFKTILRFRKYIISFPLILMILTGSIVLLISVHEALSMSAMRILNPVGKYEIVPDFSFSVAPGDTSIINGNSLELEVKYQGPRSENLFLEYRTSGADFLKQIELADHFGVFKGEIQNIKVPVEYQFRVIPEGRPAWKDKILSQIYHVDVKTPPTITEMQVRIEPPAYTRLPIQMSDKNIGNIIAYSGSKIRVTATASKNLNQASIDISDGQQIQLQIREQKLSAEFKLQKSGTYNFNILDRENLSNQNPIDYQITQLDDRFPFIDLIDPGDDIEVPPDAAIELLMEATDDFGFTNLNIHYQVIRSIKFVSYRSWIKKNNFSPRIEFKIFSTISSLELSGYECGLWRYSKLLYFC